MATEPKNIPDYLEPENRKQFIGASDMPAILGLSEYRSPLDVYNEKVGLVAPFAGNRNTERGTRLEALAAELYQERTGRRLHKRKTELIHERLDYLRGHIDRRVVGEDKRVVEIKCPSLGMFHKIKREGPPVQWLIQLQIYMLLDKSAVASFAIFCADAFDLVTFDVDQQPDLYPEYERAAAEFWERVQNRQPPEPLEVDKTKFEFLRTAGEVTRRTDDAFLEAAHLLHEADRLRRDGETLHALAKQQMIEAAGGYGKFETHGLRLHYQLQRGRTTLDKKALAAAHPEIDLSLFEKEGSPFETFRAVWLNEEES